MNIRTRLLGEPKEVEPEHPRDGAGGADHRNLARPGREQGREAQGRRRAGAEVREQVADPAQAMLDVVPVDPQEQHVAQQVHPSRVQEHRGEHGGHRRRGRPVAVLVDDQVVFGDFW